MDTKTLQTLEFDKVLARLADYAGFSVGHTRALALRPTNDLSEARHWQAQTREAALLLENNSPLTVGGTRDVRSAAARGARGFTLLPEDFLAIKNTLAASRWLSRLLINKKEMAPTLAEMAEYMADCPGLISAISETMDDNGVVLDSASPKLGRVRRSLGVVYNRVQEKLRAIINSSAGRYLQEAIITSRNGRYVIPLRAEHRGRIKGIIHDQSSSGATLWIEPRNTVEINNEYRTLHIEEQQEIARILQALSARVGEQAESLVEVVEQMAGMDVIIARANLALAMDAVEPVFVDWQPRTVGDGAPEGSILHPGSTVQIRGARHPLLEPATVIPTDLLLDEETFVVLITGPNTGGKTVALKNMGLMVLMAQAGLHLPAVEAKLTIFNDIFADIGDEQSIEQSLSTFSGHITNISRILENVDERSLVIFDELGSGTDPTEGAALAQSLIGHLRDLGATTFVATHYPELKIYASQTAGAINASMLFDIETLSPVYELVIGIPGKSNALAIARRLGLAEPVLDEAMRLIGSGNEKTDSLIDSIYDLRERIASEEASTRMAQVSAEAHTQALAARLREIEVERREIIAESRLEAAEELATVREEVRKARKKITEAASRTALKKVGKQLDVVEAAQEVPIEPILTPPEPVITKPKSKHWRKGPLKAGDRVFVQTLGTLGEVTDVQGKNAEVAIGQLRMRVKVKDLKLEKRWEEVSAEADLSTTALIKAAQPVDVKLEIDLRGERVEAGVHKCERYIEQATLAGMPWVRIIHGKGTGALRKGVREMLDANPHVSRWEEAKPNDGGAGATVVHLNVD